MNDNEAAVRITADATGVRPGVEEAKGEIAGFGPALAQLNAQFAELSTQIRESMASGAESTAEMAGEMRHLKEETEEETLSLREMVLMTHEAVEGFGEFRASLGEIAEVWMAAFAVEKVADWAKEFAEAAENVEHLAMTFGMTTAQVQALNGIALQSGVGLDAITRGMQAMDRQAVQAAQGNSAVATAFKAVGISADDGRSQIERLYIIADKFKDMADGPNKVALAMELMGRSGAALIPVLDRGADGLREMAAKAQEYDVANTAVSDSAQAKGMALAEAINEGRLAWQGVTEVLGDAFAPVLTEIMESINGVIAAMIESYNQGGIVAEVFQGIAGVVEIVGAVLNALAAIFVALWDAAVSVVTDIAESVADVFGVKLPSNMKASEVWLNVLKDAFVVLKDVVLIVVDTIGGLLVFLVDECRNFAIQAKDALTLNWGAMDKDWQDGCDRIAAHVEQAAGRIKAAMSEAAAAMAAAANGEALAGSEKPKEEGGEHSFGFNPKLGATPKEKKPKDDLVQQLDQELTAKKLAWSMEQDAQDSAQAYSLASESAFWMEALGRQDLTVKDRLAIEQKYLEAHGQLVKEDIQKSIDGFASQLEAAKGNSAAQLQIAESEADFILKKYGAESTEYAAAQKQIVKVKQEAAAQLQAIEDELSKHQQALALQGITNDEAAAKQRVAMGVETDAQMIQEQIGFEARRYQIQQQALGQQLEAELNGPNNPQKVAALYDQLEQLDAQYQAKKTELVRQGELQRKQVTDQAVTTFSGDIGKMLTAQETFTTGLNNMWKSLGGVVAKAVTNMVTAFIEGLILQDAASSTLHAKEMLRHAEEAAAGAYKAVAGIPVVGPVLAPIAAAAAFVGVMAFSSAEGGDWNVSPGMYQLHANEMVLPAWAAEPLRQMVLSPGLTSPLSASVPATPIAANSNAPAAANQNGGGDIHMHFNGPTDKASIERWMKDNHAGIAKAVAHAYRNGTPLPR